MKKILVIGSSGLVGSALKRVLGSNGIYETHQTLELIDRKKVHSRLKEVKPDFVINTAAKLGVEPCCADPEGAFAINVKAAKDLAEICTELDICLVHLSTDAVFDGRKKEFYTEDDKPTPINLYGSTKYMGELFVQDICKKYFIIRLPILFGTRENQGSIFFEKMYNLVKSGKKELSIADDAISCPSYSDDIAKGILEVIENEPHGLYHLKNKGAASLYEFTKEFFEQMGIDARLNKGKTADFAHKEVGIKPLNTSITSKKIQEMRPWQEAMADFVEVFKSKQN